MNCIEWRFATRVLVQFDVVFFATLAGQAYFSIQGTQVSELMVPVTDRQKMYRSLNCGLELAPDEFGTGGFLIRKSTGCDRFEFTQQAIFTTAGQLVVTWADPFTPQEYTSIVAGTGIPVVGQKFVQGFNFSPWIPSDPFYGYGFKAVEQGQYVSIGSDIGGDAPYACAGTFSEFKSGAICQLTSLSPIPDLVGSGTATLSLSWS